MKIFIEVNANFYRSFEPSWRRNCKFVSTTWINLQFAGVSDGFNKVTTLKDALKFVIVIHGDKISDITTDWGTVPIWLSPLSPLKATICVSWLLKGFLLLEYQLKLFLFSLKRRYSLTLRLFYNFNDNLPVMKELTRKFWKAEIWKIQSECMLRSVF